MSEILKMPNVGGHFYPGISFDGHYMHYSKCVFGCGCSMGGYSSDAPEGVDPSGSCPASPWLTENKEQISRFLRLLTLRTNCADLTLEFVLVGEGQLAGYLLADAGVAIEHAYQRMRLHVVKQDISDERDQPSEATG